MKGLNKFSMVASKVAEVILWVGLALIILGLICSCVAVGWYNGRVRSGNITLDMIEQAVREHADADTLPEGSLQDLVNNVEFFNADGTIQMHKIILTLISAVISCASFAMIFRNIYLILKTADGKTWFSKGDTPFQADITRMIREIGIFLIGLNVINLILSLFGSEIGLDILHVFIGLLMICLSGMFRYGEELQQEADTLV